jgi:guanyl-specific ribonuclease Sa
MKTLMRRAGFMTVGAALVALALAVGSRGAAAAPAVKGDSPVFASLLAAAPADQRDQIARDAASAPVAGSLVATASSPDLGGEEPECTPAPDVAPGQGFSPQVNDQVRFAAITDLLDRIANCKPLPYAHDGIVNNNKEGGMPAAPNGYYLEYTLMVPGRKTGDGPVAIDIGGQTYMTGDMQSARGPERIIIGGHEHIYYTPDHYQTFIPLTIAR